MPGTRRRLPSAQISGGHDRQGNVVPAAVKSLMEQREHDITVAQPGPADRQGEIGLIRQAGIRINLQGECSGFGHYEVDPRYSAAAKAVPQL